MMTKKEAEQEFRRLYPPETFKHPGGWTDQVARREAWNNYTDALCKEGRITEHQYNTWVHPF